MTVKQLRIQLENYKETDEVVLASDAEGNDFAKWDGLTNARNNSMVVLWPSHETIEISDY